MASLLIALIGLACDRSEHAPIGSSSSPPSEGSDTQVRAAEPRVWVGLWCESAPGPGSGDARQGSDLGPRTERSFSFYVDGREVQRAGSPCLGGAGDGPPNGAQFAVPVESGTHVLRFQDDTGDRFADQEVQTTSDVWISIRHRELGDNQGWMTTFDASYQRVPFDMTER